MRGNVLLDRKAVNQRQTEIENHRVRWISVNVSECIQSVANLLDVESRERQCRAVHAAQGQVVLNDEDCGAPGRHRAASYVN